MRKVELPEYAGDLWQPFRHLAWYGGRGGAKSRTVATGLVLQSMERHERVLCGRETQRSIKDSSKRLLDDEIDRLGVRSVFESTETEIRGPTRACSCSGGVQGQCERPEVDRGRHDLLGRRGAGIQPGQRRDHHPDHPRKAQFAAHLDLEPGPRDGSGRQPVPRQCERAEGHRQG
jgi:hypothetical protein